ncbi:hypothetical protein PQX77_010598 [Marasmius sp. AFHP31]|nr:hypothetical protein PQX77_010598 [Marasmius sp. AFHP31]
MSAPESDSLYYWSFREDGHSPLTPEVSLSLGLPVLERKWFAGATDRGLHMLRSWPSDAYNVIRRYQILRGFNPATPDFARQAPIFFQENYVFHPINGVSHRFQEINEVAEYSPSSILAAQAEAGIEAEGDPQPHWHDSQIQPSGIRPLRVGEPIFFLPPKSSSTGEEKPTTGGIGSFGYALRFLYQRENWNK